MKSRYEACTILGVGINANEEQIKAAYKKLVKLYHPDSGNMSDGERYNQVVEAYNYLCMNSVRVISHKNSFSDTKSSAKVNSSARVMGNTSNSYYKESNYSSFEKQIKRQKEEKKKRFESEMKEYSEKMQRRDEEYKKAMAAIDAIRMAEALKVLIGRNQEKDKQNNQYNE